MSAVSIAIGFRFHPTKEEVVISYLRPAIHGDPLPADVLLKIDIYGDKREPWNLFDKNSESSFWVFTKLKKRNASMIDRVGGCGSWVIQNCHEIRKSHDGKLLGYDKYLRFECKNGKSKRTRGNNNGNWTMHEFSLADKGLSEYVIYTQLIGQPNKVMISSSSPVEFTNGSSDCSDSNGNELKSLASELEEMLSIPATTSDECNIGSSIYPTNSGFVDPYYQENQCPNFVDQTMMCNPLQEYSSNEAMNSESFISELEDLLSDVPVGADECCNIGSSIYPTTHAVNSGFGEPYYEENQNPNYVDQAMIRNCNPLQEFQGNNFNDNEEMNLESFASEIEDLLSVPVSADDECNIGSSICATTCGFGEPCDQENQDPNLVDDETMIRICNPFLF
ncbi:No apical meristem (NAM) protein [Corchorus olitorius]|uniref:No apical meristem (NAM) protein n=1 Tax=Corchorus olitorius TaxID=93759 RepID=A0A1R3HXL0_9ROSI|nr:No apical meristem (NAM) protein [Corchorus olitorius]